ncbi:MAG: hypothetical protein ACOZQL_10590 [Myxococcota bacterium]
MPKPTNLAEWGTGAAPITEPLLAEKQAGWAVSTKPPAQWFNWWMKLVHLWIVWLDAFESTAHTWSALQTFNAGITAASFGTAPGPGTPGVVSTNALAGATAAAIFGSTSAGGGSSALRGVSSHAAGYGARFENTAANGFGAYATGGTGLLGASSTRWGLMGSLTTGGVPFSDAAGVCGESNIAGFPSVFGQGATGAGGNGGHFFGSDADAESVAGGVGLKFRGGASSNADGTFHAGNGMEGQAGDATGDASLGYGSNGGKNTLRGGNVDGTLNDQGLPGIGLELTGGSVTSDSYNRRGATALKATGGTGQAGRGLAIDALGDQEINGNIRLIGASVASNVAQVNQLSPGLTIKAWAKVRVASGTYQLLSGQNISSVVAGTSPTSGQLKVNLTTPIARATRGIIPFADTPGLEVHAYDYAGGLGATDAVLTFEAVSIDSAGNRAVLNLNTNSIVFTFVVFGFQ